jgi:hypothetical protein
VGGDVNADLVDERRNADRETVRPAKESGFP